jgi:starch synthase
MPFKTLARFDLAKENFSELKNNLANIMREAITQSDIITTVSPTYAKEILTSEFGCGLEDILRKRKKDLRGIINGLDYDVFNPETDQHISFPYSFHELGVKVKNKLYLQKISGLKVDPKIPILGIISRLASQKGFDILVSAFPELMKKSLQLVLLGTGDESYDQLFRELAEKYPSQFKFHNLFDVALANQIYAGADIFLMPSLYEPCGLGQLVAMKYGTLPLVRSTGGLKDTVLSAKKFHLHRATGFVFKNYTASDLLDGVDRALYYFERPKKWRQIQANAMKADFSWGHSAQEYLRVYQTL